jgi:hypothetical protein
VKAAFRKSHPPPQVTSPRGYEQRALRLLTSAGFVMRSAASKIRPSSAPRVPAFTLSTISSSVFVHNKPIGKIPRSEMMHSQHDYVPCTCRKGSVTSYARDTLSSRHMSSRDVTSAVGIFNIEFWRTLTRLSTLLTSRDLTWSSGRLTHQHASQISVVKRISWDVTYVSSAL